MTKFVLKRLAAAVGVLVVLAAVVFMLGQLTPTDPVHAMLGANASPATIKAERHKLGYDKPLPQQYVSYLEGLVHGDLGMSLRTRRPVMTDLRQYLPATFELAFYGVLLGVFLGVSLGLLTTARFKGSGLLRIVLVGLSSAPVFLLALLGILLFYRQLNWLPATGRTSYYNFSGPTGFLTLDALLKGRVDVWWDAMRHLAMPAFCVAIAPAVAIGRVLRSSLTSTMGTDYVRTARMKGLRERVVLLRHALRNSAGPALSMTGLQVGLMFAGVVVIESIFAWPGIGFYTVQSIPRNDFPAIAGVTLVLGFCYVIVNTLVEVAQAVADPRLQLAG
jgi:peptide/nickel transport system permease protein